MLNLRTRIKNLQENTSSLEAKDVCKELLENFVNLPESQISTALVEKLKSIGDADKHVARFIQATEKIESVNNLGVARAIATIKESQIYTYPGLRYGLEKIENSLMYKQVRVVESDATSKDFKVGDTWTGLNIKNNGFKVETSNVAGQPEFMLIDATLECLKTFVWDSVVEGVYKELKERREDLRESIDVAISINNMKSNKGSFFFDAVLPKLEEHFLNPTDSSRTSIIEDLRRLNFYPVAKSLSESLSKIQRTNKGGVQIIAENGKCTVSSIYSPVLLENGGEYFFSRGNYFCKKNGNISKITEEEVKTLPEKYRELCRIISSPSVFVKEGKISFYLKRDKVEILENESKVEVRFNGNKVTSNELAKNMVSAGLFRLEESKIAYDVQALAESFENIFDIDFGKVVESNVYPGSYAIIMKDNDKIYLNKVNESQKSNEYFSGLNATQARNQVLEFIGFDIKESMSEYLEKDEVELKELRESQIEIMKSIAIVEANLTKVNSVMENEMLANTPEVKELKDTLENEIASLKATHRSIAEKIKAFENKTSSDVGFEVGEEVKLTESGDLATVSSINSSRNTLIVVTTNGKTVEVPAGKAVSVHTEIANANAKNAEVNEITESKKKLA
jgi:hypothetical protein